MVDAGCINIHFEVTFKIFMESAQDLNEFCEGACACEIVMRNRMVFYAIRQTAVSTNFL